jgi:SagB-type dehydrogenase family enzyme
VAWTYHEATKHSPASVRASQRELDWPNQPLPFKIYTALEPIPLPRDFAPSEVPVLEAIAGRVPIDTQRQVDLALLARLCYYSNGVTRILGLPSMNMAFRAAACTGALYHIELYLVCGKLPDLEAGVYHYSAHDHSLRCLRTGDFRAMLIEASGGDGAMLEARAIAVCTSTFWRNAWKYQARAYRHSFWDSGTVASNLLAVAAGQHLAAGTVLAFADTTVSRLLGLDESQEGGICLLPLGRSAPPPPSSPALEPVHHPTRRLSGEQIDYPLIAELHRASSLDSGADAARWAALQPHSVTPVQTSPIDNSLAVRPSIEATIRRRGSARHFTSQGITRQQLMTLLDVAVPNGSLTTSHLIVSAVDGLASGAYTFDPAARALTSIRLGNFRDAAGSLALGQALAAEAAVNVYALSDLTSALRLLGDRGYRAAQFEGALQGGRLYLGSYALGLGATGLTFYDDDVVRFFAQGAEPDSVLFLTAIGHAVRQASA